MSSHGATKAGGVDREACTPADKENRQWMSHVFAQTTGNPDQMPSRTNFPPSSLSPARRTCCWART